VTGLLDFLVRPGFQYRRFIRPRWAYDIWEKFLRRMAGIGTIADEKATVPAKRVRAAPEVVVIGGGIAGLSAALHATLTGAQILLVKGRIFSEAAVYMIQPWSAPRKEASKYLDVSTRRN